MGEKPDEAEEIGLGDLIGRLIVNIRKFVRARADLLRVTWTVRTRALRGAAMALAAGFILCLSALTSFLVGLIMSLTPMIGPFVSTIVIGLGVTAIGGIMIFMATRTLGRQLSAALAETMDDQLVEEADAAAE